MIVNAPLALAASISALSAGDAPWLVAAPSPAKMFARPTTAAAAGFANGTLMISMRSSDEFASPLGADTHSASSPAGRIPDEPDT